MQMREVALGIQYINKELSQSQYLAFPSACLIISAHTPPPTKTTKMSFAGKWETETQEGYEEFCKLLGIPDAVMEKGRDYKLITDVTQSGNDFTWTQVYPTNATVTNKFTIGKESDMETIGGKKFKATVQMDGGKLDVTFPNYHHTSEIVGGKLIETSKSGAVVLKRTSKKI
ncbi:LOW QUALITY PROTEIN: gastrotropin-like [Limanda limanda]|uniref:LOW QUALITY PROTEIN: gastrotropin-like n=1 Tax=Limanda limanda TaxID=27771 RepID=UPI0029C9305A|nr:LOW QUALITY PROTEIN: gastrotropin-like [Limanda limanda]